MQARFWGTRGSIARPGQATVQYGGNTSCVEVRSASGTIIVLDCGTGAHDLGRDLVASGANHGHLLISHTHWDHIQGFPFFGPLFTPNNEWEIYGPGATGQHLEGILAGQMEYTYFPVTLGELSAAIHFHDLGEGTFQLGDIEVTTRYLNHPAVALGYRMEVGGVVIVYATDHEAHSRKQAEAGETPRAGATPAIIHTEDLKHAEFLSGADLVIHDSQYTAAEYPNKVGWGHSTVEYVVDECIAAGVKQLALFHHDPIRHDDAVKDILAVCEARVRQWEAPLKVFAAAEGLSLNFHERMQLPHVPTGSRAILLDGDDLKEASGHTLVIADEGEDLPLLESALGEEGYRLILATDGESALRLARDHHPSLLVLNAQMPGMSGLEVAQALRSGKDAHLREVPVVLMTRSGQEDTEAGFAAGVSDFLDKPFTPAQVRTRVREWLQRARTAKA
ncbi:MAG TPA: response regulator [Chloroflexota bacterium]